MRIDDSLETAIFIQFLCLFVISFFVMIYSNGVVTIEYIDEFNPTYTDELNFDLVEDYQNDLYKQNFYIMFINPFIYFVLMPLSNLFFGIYWFLRGDLFPFKKQKTIEIFK